jgi:hypothetical protein
MPPPRETAGWGPIRSLLCLSPLLIFVPLLAIRLHYPNGKSYTAFGHRTYYLLILISFYSSPSRTFDRAVITRPISPMPVSN